VKIPLGLEAGTYDITIEVVEDGDPWENTRTVKMSVVIQEIVEESTE